MHGPLGYTLVEWYCGSGLLVKELREKNVYNWFGFCKLKILMTQDTKIFSSFLNYPNKILNFE